MTRVKYATIFSVVLLGLVGAGRPTQAQDLDLIQGLVSELGISKVQAIGGTKALMNAAKGGLSGDEFSQLQALPELAGVMGDVGALAGGAAGGADLGGLAESAMGAMGGSDKGGDSLGALASAAAGQMEGLDLSKLSNLEGLTSAFSELGLDAGMVQKFVPVVLKSLGGSGGKSLLMKGLGIL